MESGENFQKLWCNSLKIFYNYSFLFTGVDFKGEKKEIEGKLREVLKNEEGYETNFHWGEHFSAEHTPIFPLIFLKCPHIIVNCPSRESMTLQGKIEQNHHLEEIIIKDISIKPKLILLDIGMGICRFEIEIDKKKSNLNRFEKRHLIILTNVAEVRREEQSRFRCHIKNSGGKAVNLFSIFNEEVNKLRKAVRSIDPNIKWVEKEENLTYHIEGIKESKDIEHFQDPYVTLFLEIPDNDYKQYLLDADEDTRKKEDGEESRYYRDIASILLIRSKENKNLDRSFVREYVNCVDEGKLLDSKLTNMCANSKFFMHLHTEVTLAMYSEKEKDTPLIKTSTTTLHKTISFLLMRWYSYVIANAWLDNEIATIYDQFLKLAKAPQSFNAIQNFYKKQEEIIELRGKILGILQDPITYRTSSGSSMILYENGMEKLRIKELQEIVSRKIRELDILFDSASRYISYQQTLGYFEKRQMRKERLSLRNLFKK